MLLRRFQETPPAWSWSGHSGPENSGVLDSGGHGSSVASRYSLSPQLARSYWCPGWEDWPLLKKVMGSMAERGNLAREDDFLILCNGATLVGIKAEIQ